MNRKNHSQSSLAQTIRGFKRILLVLAIFSMGINLLMLMPSIFMMQVYDRVLTSRNTTTLLMLIIITLMLYILMAILEWVRSKVLVRLGAKIEDQLNEQVFTASFISTLYRQGDDTRQAITDLAQLRQFASSNALIAFFDAPWSPIFLVFIFMLHPMLGWFSLGGMIFIATLAIINEMVTRKPLAEANSMSHQSVMLASNQLANAEVIQSMGMLQSLRDRWKRKHNQMLHLQCLASERLSIITAISKFTRVGMQSSILAIGAYLVITENLSAGIMLVVSILMGRALAPIEQMISSWRSFISSRESYKRLEKLLSNYSESKEMVSLPRPLGELQAEQLSAIAPKSQDVILRDIDFQLPAGETLMVLGASGSGKSTLARLMVGVWPPARGCVRLDGADVFKWDKTSLGPWIGYLPQDVELFDGSIAENIARFGELNSEKIVEAAQDAGIHELILSFPKGYETMIGPGGNVLSGGQRQRIGLARALYGDPALIVLDEPNSNLDEQGDNALVRAIKLLKSKKITTVIITHRPNLIAFADKMLVLNKGRVQAFGTRDTLLKSLRSASSTQGNKPLPPNELDEKSDAES